MTEDEGERPTCEHAGQEVQLGEITESIIAMAQLNFNAPPPIHGDGPLDAVAVGLVALGEELQASLIAQRQAEEANESKTRFLANISHELRTPLTTILGSAELLEKSELNQRQFQQVQQVRDAGELLMRLISDVLDFSKIEAGTLSIEPFPFKVRDCLRRVVEAHKGQANEKGLDLHDQWDTLPDIHVRGDGHRIEQVLSNVLGNAIKYTTDGRIELSGEIIDTDDEILLKLTIRDTGPGIPPDQHNKIFERFTIGDSSNRRRQSGAGLGLSISQALTEAMGGQLTLQSTPGIGSAFSVQIPVQRVRTNADAPQTTHDQEALSCRVLVVDDTAMVRKVTADMLQILGCAVDVAASGHEAMAKVADQSFDLILMDCQMPVLDGLETTRRLLSIYPDRDLQIVALTAHSSKQDEEISRAAGMVDHLNKPFRLDQLKAFVQRFQN